MVNYERHFREKSQSRCRRKLVGSGDRRGIPDPSVAGVPRSYARPAWMDNCHVGTRRHLGFRPNGLVLGHGSLQVLRLANGTGGPLADTVGKAVAESGSSLSLAKAGRIILLLRFSYHFFNRASIHSAIVSSATGAMVSSIVPYSPTPPVLQVWNR